MARKRYVKPLVRCIVHSGSGHATQHTERRNIYTRADGTRYVLFCREEIPLQTDAQGDFYEIGPKSNTFHAGIGMGVPQMGAGHIRTAAFPMGI